uniref:MACPF domain-containing protein n=2 Tax=Mucochytrium quahogii TaxID=96639 RepID=A0A7S2RF39_9STRA|mmetsp:Transcript_14042/g.30410  ORF Transcript_14042/g.30410 Transcript_14042/m.30410 type:complete len:566 (+) Transcript_14042:251-1948(+)
MRTAWICVLTTGLWTRCNSLPEDFPVVDVSEIQGDSFVASLPAGYNISSGQPFCDSIDRHDDPSEEAAQIIGCMLLGKTVKLGAFGLGEDMLGPNPTILDIFPVDKIAKMVEDGCFIVALEKKGGDVTDSKTVFYSRDTYEAQVKESLGVSSGTEASYASVSVKAGYEYNDASSTSIRREASYTGGKTEQLLKISDLKISYECIGRTSNEDPSALLRYISRGMLDAWLHLESSTKLSLEGKINYTELKNQVLEFNANFGMQIPVAFKYGVVQRQELSARFDAEATATSESVGHAMTSALEVSLFGAQGSSSANMKMEFESSMSDESESMTTTASSYSYGAYGPCLDIREDQTTCTNHLMSDMNRWGAPIAIYKVLPVVPSLTADETVIDEIARASYDASHPCNPLYDSYAIETTYNNRTYYLHCGESSICRWKRSTNNEAPGSLFKLRNSNGKATNDHHYSIDVFGFNSNLGRIGSLIVDNSQPKLDPDEDEDKKRDWAYKDKEIRATSNSCITIQEGSESYLDALLDDENCTKIEYRPVIGARINYENIHELCTPTVEELAIWY